MPTGFTDEPDKFALLVEMLRITFPYLLLVSMTALCGSILNSYARFAVPAVTPALLNVISNSLLISSSALYARPGIGAGVGCADRGSCAAVVSIAVSGSHAANASAKGRGIPRGCRAHQEADGASLVRRFSGSD